MVLDRFSSFNSSVVNISEVFRSVSEITYSSKLILSKWLSGDSSLHHLFWRYHFQRWYLIHLILDLEHTFPFNEQKPFYEKPAFLLRTEYNDWRKKLPNYRKNQSFVLYKRSTLLQWLRMNRECYETTHKREKCNGVLSYTFYFTTVKYI